MKIYHNPRCSKSRQTLEILQNNNIDPDIVLYLEDAPDKNELDELCKQLDVEPDAIIRFKEDLAKDIGIAADDKRSRDEWLQIIADNPKLLERPIVSNGKTAIIGRPPENVETLIK